MTSESTLHRWAMLDKSGKTRGTCEAITKGFANTLFRRKMCKTPGQIRAKLPAGWTIVDRGTVDEPVQRAADAFHKTLAETKPRPFQVGDRVVVAEGGEANFFKTGDTATLTEWDGEDWWGIVNNPNRTRPKKDGSVCLTQSGKIAPQPKDEDVALVGAMSQMTSPTVSEVIAAKDAEIATLKAEEEDIRHRYDAFLTRMEQIFPEAGDRTELLGCAEAAKAEIASISSEITSLKAEMERLGLELLEVKTSRSGWMQDAELYAQNAAHHETRANEAEAKLADIRALVRTWKILHKLDTPPESLSDAVAHVLGGAA